MSETTTWHHTACILCSINCGVEVRARRPAHRARPRRQVAPRLAGLHLREGAAARPLPERPRPADEPAAPPRRRHVRAGRLGHRDRARSPRASPRSATSTAASRSSITAAAARGTTSAAATAARRAPRLGSVYTVERARAGEDRRVLGRRPALRPPALPHHRRLRARRGRGVRRQEPVAVARLPARPRRAQGDREGPRRAR